MTTHHAFSPSKLGTMTKDRCPGRSREERKWPEIVEPGSVAGTEAHEHFAKALMWLSSHGVQEIAGIECPLPVHGSDGEILTEGIADLVLLRGDLIEVVDWKFSHEPLDEEAARIQITCYCVGAMQLTQRIGSMRLRKHAIGWLYLPRLDLEYKAEVELDRGLAEIESIVRGASRPDAPLKAGEWCRWCSARVGCPALRESAIHLASSYGVARTTTETKTALRTRYDGQLAEMAARGEFDRIAELARLGHVVEPAVDAAKAMVKQLVLEGHADKLPGWSIETKNPRYARDINRIFERLAPVMSKEEFLSCLDVSIPELEQHYYERLKLNGNPISRAEANRRFAELLGDCIGFTEQKALRRTKA